jgi:hypothetical protein
MAAIGISRTLRLWPASRRGAKRQTQVIDLAPLLVCGRCGKRGPLPHIKGIARRST